MITIHECSHEQTEIRRKQISGGAFQIKAQCLQCGRSIGNPIAKAKAPAIVPDWDVELEQQGEQAASEAWKMQGEIRSQELAQKSAEWWAEYNLYLASPEWRRKKALVHQRDRYQCLARLDGCTGGAEECHHLTYRHRGNEPLFDLISVCGPCHRQITRMDREKV